MFNAILKFSIAYRYAVLIMAFAIGVLGSLSYQYLIIDAVPDITNIQVQVNTAAPGYSPFEAEQRITAPLERLFAGLPQLDYTRSLSRYGLSQITIIFKDGTDIYFARQLISQRLQEARDQLPGGITPTMGPSATGLGEIFMFTVENAKIVDGISEAHPPKPRTLLELREIQDWVVKPQLRMIPGVVEINSIGGASKQILLTPDLSRLRAFALSLDDISIAVAQNNLNVGAGYLEQNGEQYLIRVPAQVEDINQLNFIPVGVHNGNPILLKDVATVGIGSELRTGAATENGEEVVLGTVFMLMGENGRAVSQRVEQKLKDIQSSLPSGVTVRTVYNRSNLIDATLATVRKNLLEGALFVLVILFVALGNIRAAVITALVIPLSMVMTIFGMVYGHLSANLMSLGALDFGLIVDGAVILVENCVKRFAEAQSRLGRLLTKQERLDITYEASSEVRQATMFGELIIMVVYIPILTLSGVEGKMYHPMALTVLLALGAAFLLSLTFVPAAVAVFITGPVKTHGRISVFVLSAYRSLLRPLLRFPVVVALLAVCFFVFSLAQFSKLGSEFMPSLDEGDIALHAIRIPGTSLTQAISMQHQLEEAIQAVAEVSHTFAKIGTAEVANDPMPPSVADGFIIMKPRTQWSDPHKPKSEVIKEIERVIQRVPGNNYEFTQPIQMRFNELIAGVRSDVAVKVFGDDSEVLASQGEIIRQLLDQIPGASDTKVEQVTGLPMVIVTPDRSKYSRFGLHASAIQNLVQTAYAGTEVSRFYDGDRNFPIVLRLSEKDRTNINAISSLPLALPLALPTSTAMSNMSIESKSTDLAMQLPEQRYITLGDVATVHTQEGPNQITRENGKRRVVVTTNVRGRDLGSFVEEAQTKLATSLTLPANYWLGWGGQYENLLSAKSRLSIVVPIVLLSVFGLIFVTFRSWRYSLLVFSGVPFALSGGILALSLRDIPFSISAAVGFIALSGVSVLNGLVLVSFTRKLILDGEPLRSAVLEGAVSRLRPVLMTAFVASLGFLPMAFSEGTGSEVQRPLATVVIGGIISSTILTLFVLPCLVAITGDRKRKVPPATQAPTS